MSNTYLNVRHPFSRGAEFVVSVSRCGEMYERFFPDPVARKDTDKTKQNQLALISATKCILGDTPLGLVRHPPGADWRPEFHADYAWTGNEMFWHSVPVKPDYNESNHSLYSFVPAGSPRASKCCCAPDYNE